MPSVLPLRAIALQILFLLIAIAIESSILYRQLKITPREGVQYAATLNLLSTVMGWIVIFIVLNTGVGGQIRRSLDVEIALISLVLFNQAVSVGSNVVGVLVLGALAAFPASFAVKQFGLVLLKWVLDPSLAEAKPLPQPEVRSVMRNPREVVRKEASSPVLAVFLANLLSYGAIVLVLLLLIFIQGGIAL
ncbi:filament integrity protein FraC [Leptolyngbya sp. FACHB-711]|uniref:filament integrity protein FraC n=1 Tax=unclassified Leptolyngbya TaxID=2650499 RepID=UPI001684C477|nr:filament integrity protein FraC [Leptolyngbya sp. FACHB-711]MBD1851551.1 hypothetical protein [Cyanobacteria bacterium FACHB-502]MBD2025022.1 hypothetical protein [Leptolyngbya sp. FACHB-711]